MAIDRAIRGEQLFALRQLQLPNVYSDGCQVSGAALKSVLRSVDDHADPHCWASTATIAVETCLSDKTVRRSLKALLALNLLVLIDGKAGRSSCYSINWDKVLTPVVATEVRQTATPVVVSRTPVVTTMNPGSADPNPGSSYRRNEKKRERNEKKRNTVRARRFSAPSLDEVREFWKASSLNGSPDEFHDHYQANGWTQGRRSTAMKDWHAAARNWSRRQEQFNRPAFGGKPRTANVGAGVVFKGEQSEDPNFGKF